RGGRGPTRSGAGAVTRPGTRRPGTRLAGVRLTPCRRARLTVARATRRSGIAGVCRATGADGRPRVVAVKATALEDHSHRAVKFPQDTGAFRALGEVVVGKRLDRVELVAAGLASVLVGGHVPFLSLGSD